MIFDTETIYEDKDVICSVVRPIETDEDVRISEDRKTEAMRSCFNVKAIRPTQTHSVNVGVVDGKDHADDFPDTDALVSFDSQAKVGVVTADCVPILLYAPDIEATAAIHAGWKGTLGGIIDNAVKILIQHGANPALMRVIFGPSISKEVYEVDFELAQKFLYAGFEDCVDMPAAINGLPKPHIDLQGVNIHRLLRLGIPTTNIYPSDQCTYSSKSADGSYLYPSYRRQKTSLRLLTLISLRHPKEADIKSNDLDHVMSRQ